MFLKLSPFTLMSKKTEILLVARYIKLKIKLSPQPLSPPPNLVTTITIKMYNSPSNFIS